MLVHSEDGNGHEYIVETPGGLKRTATDHLFGSNSALIAELQGRITGDLGSGAGGFALEMYAESALNWFSAEIHSINPRITSTDADLNRFHQESQSLILFQYLCHLPRSQRIAISEAATNRYLATRHDNSWDNLSDFPDGFFDVMLATGSYVFYPDTYTPDSLNEIMRTIKPGGYFQAGFYVRTTDNYDEYEAIASAMNNQGYAAEIRYNKTGEHDLPSYKKLEAIGVVRINK